MPMPSPKRLLLIVSAIAIAVGILAAIPAFWSSIEPPVTAALTAVWSYWYFSTIILGVAGIVTVILLPGKPRQSVHGKVRPIGWRVITITVLSTLALGMTVTLLLLREAEGASDQNRPGLRVDAIKTGVTVALGTGGVAAFLLAFRKQRLDERVQAFKEELELEKSLQDTYKTAVDQVGDSVPTKRLSGLQTYAELANRSPHYRTIALEDLCGLLRNPLDYSKLQVDGSDVTAIDTAIAGELEVRRQAQRTIAEILVIRDALVTTDALADDLNLSGAVLVSFNLVDCSVGRADFTRCIFLGDTKFKGTTFKDIADFGDATFNGSVGLEHAVFKQSAYFNGGVCTGDFNASGAFFDRLLRCDERIFGGSVVFQGTILTNDSWFSRATFKGSVQLAAAKFAKTPAVDGAKVEGLDNTLSREWPRGWKLEPGPTPAATGRLMIS